MADSMFCLTQEINKVPGMLCCRPLSCHQHEDAPSTLFQKQNIGQCRTLAQFIDDTMSCFGQYSYFVIIKLAKQRKHTEEENEEQQPTLDLCVNSCRSYIDRSTIVRISFDQTTEDSLPLGQQNPGQKPHVSTTAIILN